MKEGREKTGGAGGGLWAFAWNSLVIGSLVATNILSLYSLTVSREVGRHLMAPADAGVWQLTRLAQELASLRQQLDRDYRNLTDWLRHQQPPSVTPTGAVNSDGDATDQNSPFTPRLIPELTAFSAVRALPLGRNPASGEDTIVAPVGHPCHLSLDLLQQYMNYSVGSLCPDDWDLAQRLMVRGCEPLPRRRCFARTPANFPRAPDPLWTVPKDDAILWTHYGCKSFACLKERPKTGRFADCLDCFDLDGPEKERWIKARDRGDFTIEEVVSIGSGRFRIGLDIGGGSGTFAARLHPYNVTIITSTLNFDGPFNEFVSLRGLLALYITVSQRLPFFDNTLDLVHSMHVLSYWIPPLSLEFLLFDIDRVLRPGGFLWLDHFYATSDGMVATFIPMIRRLGYVEHRWATFNKNDPNGIKNQEVYLSALLEKPVRTSSLYT